MIGQGSDPHGDRLMPGPARGSPPDSRSPGGTGCPTDSGRGGPAPPRGSAGAWAGLRGRPRPRHRLRTRQRVTGMDRIEARRLQGPRAGETPVPGTPCRGRAVPENGMPGENPTAHMPHGGAAMARRAAMWNNAPEPGPRDSSRG